MRDRAPGRVFLEAMRTAPATAIAPSPGWEAVAEGLVGGPDPEGAIVRALTLPDAVLAQPLPRSLCRLLHQGGYAARLINIVPDAVEVLEDAPPPSPAHDALALSVRLGRAMDELGPTEALGRTRTRAYLHLARREVEGAAIEEVGTELCNLATGCIEAGLRHLHLHETVVVFGMGKLAGNELNFLSDIDLLFVHDDEIGAGDDAPRAPLVRLHEGLRQLVRMLEGEGRFKPLFRVDLRLRPFGARGPLSMSLSATESYYERYGRDWERQAWLRARPIAGNLELGHRMLERLRPFVYRRSVTPAIFQEIGDLMRRARRDAVGPGLDVKLDAGGIREIEFSVQALQLLHGGKNPLVRTPSTLIGLDRLFATGLMSDREHRDLGHAYRFLRRVEHRLQLGEGQQTHRLPSDPQARRRLVARLEESATASLEGFEATLAEHRARVVAVARSITGDSGVPDLDAAFDERERLRATVLDLGAPPKRRLEALQHLGLGDPEEAEALIQHLASRPDGALASRGAARQGAENLLLACLDAAEPEVALARFVEFAALRPAHYGVWRFLAEPPVEGRDIVRLTAELFGTSEPLSAGLIGFPIAGGALQDESIGLLLGIGASALPGPDELAEDLRSASPDPRGLDASLLRFKHRALVHIGLHDIGHRPDPLGVGHALSDVADVVLRLLLRDLAAEFARQRPSAHGLRMAVFGLGKYGMQAMDYGSDLDLMFVYAMDGATERAIQGEAIRFGQRLMTRLQDRTLGMRLYEVDMRLRPSGRQGLLVTSVNAFRRYHERPLPVWEQLALLRLRPIGEVSVEPGLEPVELPGAAEEIASASIGPRCAEVDAVVRQSLTQHGPLGLPHVASEVRRLLDRIAVELARENRKTGHYNAKTGRGGVLELELLVSALQLAHADEHPGVLARGIVDALWRLVEHRVIDPSEATALAAAYRFQRLLLNRLRMTSKGGIDDPDRFAQNSPRLTTLARRMGLPDRDALLSRLFTSRAVVRDALDRHLSDDGSPRT